MAAPLVMGLRILCNHLGTLLLSARAGDPSHQSLFYQWISRYSVVIIFLKQPDLGALGQWGAHSRWAASSAVGELKTQCQGNKKKCKVNKNNSKCTYEWKNGVWKLISRRVFCLVWSLIGAGGSFEGKINALTPGIINALSWWFKHVI